MSSSVLHKYFGSVVTIVCALLFAATSFAQTSKFAEYHKIFTDYSSHHLQEKIFVHTDRSFYLCGEILWFKAYLMNAATNKPLSISKVVYVEIMNNKHDPVLQAKVAVKNGSASGSFNVSTALSSGNYELRAYTNWMKNDSASFYFKKIITIVNTTQSLDTSMINTHVETFVQFFPEGGNLVNGLNSVVGFKVNDSHGRGINCKGVVVDQLNDTVAQFESLKFGMGKFSFTPLAGKDYSAIVTCNDGSVIRKALPATLLSGYVMKVSEEGEKLVKVTVQLGGFSDSNSPGKVYLIVHQGSNVVLAKSQTHIGNVNTFSINKDSLTDGLTQFTLFNEVQPLCERLYFKRPADKMFITAHADKQSFRMRDRVNLNFSATDASGREVASNLSASVYRLDKLQGPQQEDIFSYVWFSSNLVGYIEDPSYYLENNDAVANEALDNLLLTQGWSKFDPGKMAQNQRPVISYVPENRGLIITGRITNEETGKPASGILVYLSVPGKRIQLYGCRSNNDGIIHFEMKDFYGANQVVLQTNTTRDSIYHLEILSPFSEKVLAETLPGALLTQEDHEDLETENLRMRIENAYHKNELQKFSSPLIDTLPFFYTPYKTYMLDDYTRFTTMEEVMREYVAEVNVTIRNRNYHLNVINMPAVALKEMQPTEIVFKDDPLVLLDGVPVFDIDKIVSYDPLKVKKLSVVASRYYWGPIVADGIVSYTTYQGNLQGYTLNPHDVILDYEGLQRQRVFYSPDYSSADELNSRLPDFRDLLYWSPDVATDGKSKSDISFYTGDVAGKYLIVLQGISSCGKVGATSFTIDVHK